MKRKPLKLDWEELESAFDNKREDLVYYLDLVTGQVVLEGEGEDAMTDDELDESAEPHPATRKLADRLYVESPDEEAETAWMEQFVERADDLEEPLREQLRHALAGPDPVDDFREALRSRAAERDRWFLFRSERLREAIDAWLGANRVVPTEPAPWRS